MSAKDSRGLTNQLKDKIIQQALDRRLQRSHADAKTHTTEINTAFDSTATATPMPTPMRMETNAIPAKFTRFDQHPGYQQLRIMNDMAAAQGIANPFFKLHHGVSSATTHIAEKTYINFSSYNYVGLSGDIDVANAAKAAIDLYGTSVSASRVVSGERPIHRELEAAIAGAYGVDDAVTFVSGHATNVSTIGYLFGAKDLIVHDQFIHNSAMQGIQLSGAKRLMFPHNDWAALDQLLAEQRKHFERVLVVVEGVYSMDGDFPDLPKFIAIKQKHRAFLMVDEAHSFGVMGKTGMGIREHFGLSGKDVDIWMGTLSKTLAGCGGYIAGETALVENLKFLAPGFLYSVGMPPPVAAASLAALQKLQREPERVARLVQRGQQFLAAAKQAGVDTGTSAGLAVVPAITRSSTKAAKVSAALFAHGINAQPILYPAVPEHSARIRFFMSSEHTESQISETVKILAEEIARA